MGLGELILVAFGERNLYLSHNPKITFFKKVYKKHSNFAIESIPQYLKVTPNFGKKVTVNISKNADLLSKIYLYVELPSLTLSNHTSLPSGIKKVRWVDKIGLALIEKIELEIGGIIIDRITGDWLNISYETTLNDEQYSSYNKMIGNTDDLKKFTNGKDKYNLHIPLNFWFCQNYGLSLPIIALTHHDIKIHIHFNKFNKCIKESPTHYFTIDSNICLFDDDEIIKQTINGTSYIGQFVYFDVTNSRVYYNKILGDFQVPTTVNTLYNITGQSSGYSLMPKPNTFIITDEEYFYFGEPILEDAYLMVDYIYLDSKERWEFSNKNHEYLIPKVSNLSELALYSTNNTYKIPLMNPNKIILWRGILQSNKTINDNFNYTSYPLTDNEDDLIENHQIVINSIKRIEIDKWQHYSYLQNYQSKFSSPQKGIYSYSFCLNPKDYQPSGSFNFSKIDDSYLQVTLNSSVNYQNPVDILLYGIEYNIFSIIDGLGGLKYVL
jgi:hypothetical protein